MTTETTETIDICNPDPHDVLSEIEGGRTAEIGVWTPWATVQCRACQNETRTDHPIHKTLPAMSPVARPNPYDLIVPCEDCERPIWMCEEVGLAYLVVRALRSSGEYNAEMQQTGGMCSAALVTRVGDPHPWSNETGDPRDDVPFVYVTALDGPLVAGLYVSAERFDCGDCGHVYEEWSDWAPTDNQHAQMKAVSQAITWIRENL